MLKGGGVQFVGGNIFVQIRAKMIGKLDILYFFQNAVI